MGWGFGKRNKTGLGHTQLGVLIKAFHVCIYLGTPPHHHHHCLQSTDQWRCQLLTAETPGLLLSEVHRQVYLPATAEFHFPSQNTFFQSNQLQFSFLLLPSSHFPTPDIANISEIIEGLWFSTTSDILRRHRKGRLTLTLTFFNSSSSLGSTAQLYSILVSLSDDPLQCP